MGSNLALQVLEKGHKIVTYDTSEIALNNFQQIEGYDKEKAILTNNFQTFIKHLDAKDIVFVLLPQGQVTNEVLNDLVQSLPNDVYVLEGGNSNYKEALEWFKKFEYSDKYFFDMGTSGGLKGARHGMCAMIGGNENAFKEIEVFLQSVCCEGGLLFTGPAGSGHYLKMVHNGIEYGMMQAIAEGYEVLENSQFDYDYKRVSQLWNQGSIIKSELIELLVGVFDESPDLSHLVGKMNASGEAQWLVEEAMDLKVPVPVITLSLMVRNRSLQGDTFSGKVVSALRNAFGGHEVEKVKINE